MGHLNKIENNFKGMVKTGKVDLSIINDLKKFKNDLVNSKSQFSDKRHRLGHFPIFHAIETQIRVIDHMIYRVNIAPKIHDNPEVADDALSVMPQLMLVTDSLRSKMKFDPHYMMDISSRLQILAMKSNMYPPPNQITKSVSKARLKDNFNRFVNRVGEEIERT